ncbi:MAG: glycerol-3-phosphate acyltransferase [Bacteroidetes bacterium]|nr:glycerol-3-phosphate acyltransferase [Bacteroidota bacterium]
MIPFLALCVGYLIGSIPSAYLIVRKRTGVDIRTAGSGNVGGYNAAHVTGSKWTGVAVGLLDGMKGVVASFGAWWIFPDEIIMQYAATLGAVVGHNYPVWLRFKGGRGLATGAGMMFGLGVFYTLAWTLSWVVLHRLTKDIIRSNVLATIIAPVLTWIVPAVAVSALLVRPQPVDDYAWYVSIVSVLLILSHADALRDPEPDPSTPPS